MLPRKRPINGNPTTSNSDYTGPIGGDTLDNTMRNQFQQIMQAMLDQPSQANENQARLQEQILEKDEDHARELADMQRQLLEVLPRRPESVQAQLAIVINQRKHDPNALFERFRKRGPKEFLGTKDPLAADNWLEHTENIFESFQCTGGERVKLATFLFNGSTDTLVEDSQGRIQNYGRCSGLG
jgi:hypothetical protein